MSKVLLTVPWGSVIRVEHRVHNEGKSFVEQDLKFTGNPERHAKALVTAHNPSGALGLITSMEKNAPLDAYWQAVRQYVMNAVKKTIPKEAASA